MSYKLQDAVWLLGLPHTEKAGLGVLSQHAGEDGANPGPSVETITHMTGLNRRTVQRALRSLMCRNIIAAVYGVSGGGGGPPETGVFSYALTVLRSGERGKR